MKAPRMKAGRRLFTLHVTAVRPRLEGRPLEGLPPHQREYQRGMLLEVGETRREAKARALPKARRAFRRFDRVIVR